MIYRIRRKNLGGLAAVALALIVGGCGQAAPEATPTKGPWAKTMAATTCREWRDNDVMSDAQRRAAANAVVTEKDSLPFVFAVDETCDTLDRLATDESDPASIQDVMELVLLTEDFAREP